MIVCYCPRLSKPCFKSRQFKSKFLQIICAIAAVPYFPMDSRALREEKLYRCIYSLFEKNFLNSMLSKGAAWKWFLNRNFATG